VSFEPLLLDPVDVFLSFVSVSTCVHLHGGPLWRDWPIWDFWDLSESLPVCIFKYL